MTPEQREVFEGLPQSVLAALLRIGRRIRDGYEGTIEIQAHRRGVATIKWSQVESGDKIREELGGNGNPTSR